MALVFAVVEGADGEGLMATIPPPASGFELWRAERLPSLAAANPGASVAGLAQLARAEWASMNGTQQQPYHAASQAASVASGYHAADLQCVFCMRRSLDPEARGWSQLSAQHALDFATGAYGNDAQMAINTFLTSRNQSCWFCPASPPAHAD